VSETRGIAIVIGSAGGIGAACSKRLMATGLFSGVLGVDRVPQPAAGNRIVDLAVAAERERLVADVLASPARIGAFVYAAGIARALPTGPGAWPLWQELIEVDFTAAAHLLCALHDRFVVDGTATVVIDSTAADIGSSTAPPYAAAKAACRLVTRSLSTRTGSSGARYNSVAPGPIETELGRRLAEQMGTTQQVFADRTVAQRLGTSDEVAAAVAFLCSPDASYINGTVVVVDGGYLAG